MSTDLQMVLAYEGGRDEADAEWAKAIAEACAEVGSSAVMSKGPIQRLLRRMPAAARAALAAPRQGDAEMLPDEIDIPQLKAQLALRGMTQLDLARLIGRPVSTFANWVRGAHPSPPGTPALLERVLGLEAGALAKGRAKP